MKRITVRHRLGHKLAEEAEACLMALNRGSISAHPSEVEQGYNMIWIEHDADLERTSDFLRSTASRQWNFLERHYS